MPKLMAATALGAGGAVADPDGSDPQPVPTEQEPGGAASSPQPDSADAPSGDPEVDGSEDAEAPGATGNADKRLSDTQRALHAAREQNKGLVEALKKQLPQSAPATPTGTAADSEPVRTGPIIPAEAVPTRKLADGRIVLDLPLPLTADDVEHAFQINSDEKLDNRTAFHRSMGGLFATYHERFLSEVVPLLMKAAVGNTARELVTHSAQVRGAATTKKEIETYWKNLAPAIPPRFIWSFGPEAIQAHPGKGPEAIGRQALYCLEKALGEWTGSNGASPHTDQAATAQDVLLRAGEGGGGRPVGSRGGTPAGTSRMTDQIKAANRPLRAG